MVATPSSRKYASLAGLVVVAMTSTPSALAIWIATDPTPPVAP